MTAQDRLLAMKGARVLVPETDLELVFYAAFCHGLGELDALTPQQRAALAAALDAFRAAYHRGWVRGTVFLTATELVFIARVAHRKGRPADLAFRVPLTDILALQVAGGLLRDTLTVSTMKGRFQLRLFMARRFGARIERACTDRIGELSSGGLQAQAA
jgi:hypothetical protein